MSASAAVAPELLEIPGRYLVNLTAAPDIERLRAMRQRLSSPAYAAAFVDAMRAMGSPGQLAELQRQVAALAYACGDRANRSGSAAKILEILAMTGGAGLFFGSIVATLSLKYPLALVAVVPAVLGLLTGAAGAIYYRVAEHERHLYACIADAAARLQVRM